jgi:hypothetical protein
MDIFGTDGSGIQINWANASIKIVPRSRDRMKLQVKLSKVEAQAFKNFMQTVKPQEIDEAAFIKALFTIGMETMEQKLLDAAKEYVEENRESLLASGVDLSDFEDSSDNVEIVE